MVMDTATEEEEGEGNMHREGGVGEKRERRRKEEGEVVFTIRTLMFMLPLFMYWETSSRALASSLLVTSSGSRYGHGVYIILMVYI